MTTSCSSPRATSQRCTPARAGSTTHTAARARPSSSPSGAGGRSVPHIAIAYVTLATVHLWWNELDEAERAGDLALEAVGRSVEPLLAPVAAQIRAKIQAVRGDPMKALEILRAGDPGPKLPHWLRVSASLLEAELWLAAGRAGASPPRTRGDAALRSSPTRRSASRGSSSPSATRKRRCAPSRPSWPTSATRSCRSRGPRRGRWTRSRATRSTTSRARCGRSSARSTSLNRAGTRTRSCATARRCGRSCGAGSPWAPRTARSPATSCRRSRSSRPCAAPAASRCSSRSANASSWSSASSPR